MVTTLSVITKKDAQLALVWRFATMRNSKLSTVNKKNILQHNVRNSCKAIVSMIEKSRTDREMLSLYIMAQLVYGTTILFSRQVDYLFLDVNELVSFIKYQKLQLFQNLGIMLKKDGKKRKGKNEDEDYQTPKKRSKKKLTDENMNLEGTQLLNSQARPDLITLREEFPVMNKNFDLNLMDDLVPLSDTDFNNMYQSMSQTFYDFQKSSGTGQNQIEDIRNANSFFDDNLVQLPEITIQPPDADSLQQSMNTPAKVYSNERIVPAPGLEDILTMGFENLRRGKTNNSMDLDEELEHMKRASMNHPVEDMPFVAPQQFPTHNFELSEISPEDLMLQTPMKTPTRRKRSSDTQITHAEMREMQNNYDSLLQPIDKFKIKVFKSYELSLKELMNPLPVTIRRNKMAREMAEMYRQAAAETVKFDPNVGTGISDENDEEENEMSTENSRKTLPIVDLDMDNLRFLTTPIKIQQTPPSTPRRNFEQNDFEIPRASPLNVTPLQYIEFGSQTRLTDEMNKVISPFNSQPIFHENPANDIPGSEIRQKIVKACEMRAPFSASLNDVLNSNDGRRMAARTFYVLLEMTKERIVKVRGQSAPFANIEFNLRTEDSKDQEDLEEFVSSENNKGFIASSENSQE